MYLQCLLHNTPNFSPYEMRYGSLLTSSTSHFAFSKLVRGDVNVLSFSCELWIIVPGHIAGAPTTRRIVLAFQCWGAHRLWVCGLVTFEANVTWQAVKSPFQCLSGAGCTRSSATSRDLASNSHCSTRFANIHHLKNKATEAVRCGTRTAGSTRHPRKVDQTPTSEGCMRTEGQEGMRRSQCSVRNVKEHITGEARVS